LVYFEKVKQQDYKLVLSQAKEDLRSAQKDMGDCLKRQEELEKQILGLRQTIVAIARMVGEPFDEEEEIGLTEAVRQAFILRGNCPLMPTEVRGVMEGLGYDISKYGNFMASLHSVINRLVQKGEVKEAVMSGTAKPAYVWVAGTTSPGSTPHPVVKSPSGPSPSVGGIHMPRARVKAKFT
jgi:hypothetical protein